MRTYPTKNKEFSVQVTNENKMKIGEFIYFQLKRFSSTWVFFLLLVEGYDMMLFFELNG
jgi:hypothetical protein